MKITVQRDDFARLLARAQGVVEKKSTVTVLSHLLLETVGKEEIKLTCTDYDVVLIDHCPAQIESEGRVVVSGRVLFDIVKVLPAVDVVMEKLEGERLQLLAGTSKYNLAGFDPDDFPRIEKGDQEPGFKLPVIELRRMLAKSAICMSTEESRPNLNGVYFDMAREGGGGIVFRCVATDGHRLARVEKRFDGIDIPFDSRGVIVHRKGITELKKILDSESGEVKVGFASGEVVFRVGSAALFVREIDEDYPDYESVIPGEFARDIRVDRAELLEGMRRVMPLADPSVLVIKMEARPESLVLTSANLQTGSGETMVFADYDGEPVLIGFNQRYLQDAAAAVEAPRLVFRLPDSGSPCIIEPVDSDEGVLFILMPVEDA